MMTFGRMGGAFVQTRVSGDLDGRMNLPRIFQRTLSLPLAVAMLLLIGSKQGAAVVPQTPTPTLLPSTISSTDPILVGAGDIASCTVQGDIETAKLIDGVLANAPGKAIVFTAGDNAYETGSTANYRQCYAPNWGRFKKITRPTPGNHDYATPGAAAYFAYFGANAGPVGRGYYSYNLGAWHIVSLDSDIDGSPGSAQDAWLRADLKANRTTCILAYWLVM